MAFARNRYSGQQQATGPPQKGKRLRKKVSDSSVVRPRLAQIALKALFVAAGPPWS